MIERLVSLSLTANYRIQKLESDHASDHRVISKTVFSSVFFMPLPMGGTGQLRQAPWPSTISAGLLPVWDQVGSKKLSIFNNTEK